MFIYLSKKIAIPNNTTVKCLSWNKDQGYISCGGDSGLLKVLKLESGKDSTIRGIAAPSNLSMNQTLEGHTGAVQVVTWNEQHQKLTSSDQNGLIIVWTLFKGSWYEEMINNRNKSVVKDMSWNSVGQKICIIYDDGAVIVGSVDGNRLWGKELKGVQLNVVEWSPEGTLILFGMQNNEIHIYDRGGNMVTTMEIHCLVNVTGAVKLVSIDWYNGCKGYADPTQPCLLIGYDNGRLQVMRDESDDEPILVDAGIAAVCAKWNHNGSIFAVCGQMITSDNVKANLVQLYTPYGQHIHSLKIPGKNIQAASWEACGLRIALAVDSYIYFANIRPDYKWCYFANTVVYAHNKPDRDDVCIVFFNIYSCEKYIKYMKQLLMMTACNDHCVLISKTEDSNGQYAVILCNAIGTPVESRYINIKPEYLYMNKSQLFCASKEAFYVWHFKIPKDKTIMELSSAHGMSRRTLKERLYHIDDNPSGAEDALNDPNAAFEPTDDPICCMCASDKKLIVARNSGLLQQYDLPHVALRNRYNFCVRPSHMRLNCTSTMLTVIDVNGIMTLYDLENKSVDDNGRERQGSKISFDRKDVWDVKWATDNPDMFAIMEKTRMYVFRNLEPEEPVLCSGYLCLFEDLQVRAILLDEILCDPEKPSKNDVMDMEVKLLRDARELLLKASIEEATRFIEENPHPRLWKLLAETALKKLDLKTAENAFVRCKDYQGIEFVKKLTNLQNENLKRAEVLSFFKQFEDAEKIYLEIDRRDLAVALRCTLGDWFRVVELLKGGSTGVRIDVQMDEAMNAIGDYYADRHLWNDAVKYYEQGRNQRRLADCYYMLEDYAGLERLMQELPENHQLLNDIGNKFASVGMCDEAVAAYVKTNKVKMAVDCCVLLNQWNTAVELARKHNVHEISGLLTKYARHLIEENNIMQAIQLYRKANMFLQAAQLAFNVAKEESLKKCRPVLLKRMFTMAALLVNDHHYHIRNTSKSAKSSSQAASALAGLLEEDNLLFGDSIGSDGRVIDQAWKGVEAYHYYILAQRQLYQGNVDAAMKTALYLREYEDFINLEEIYSMIALTSCANRAFGTCSKAFIKLESMDAIDADVRQKYEELAMDIFTKHAPKDSHEGKEECIQCETLIPDWCSTCPSCGVKFSICVATGRPIHDPQPWTCNQCKHKAYVSEITTKYENCPLCYTPVISVA